MSLVLDGSVALSWSFVDEQNEDSSSLLRRVGRHGAVVPPLWRYEIANGLQMAVRRRRIDIAFRDETLRDLESLPIVIDQECEAHLWSTTIKLAERHDLTVYDAAYLELAQRRRLPLATFDAKLIAAAEAELVPVVQE
ncbi:type II toxin-antitoxin system VapC family toxin [Afifella pfennigii]|uniref:type II toxin-antitoxin system VapC family toxin n=1 Tax=Afifella pfennigii TaxID=209897 RepID=UPI00047A9E90|nr:type II toxin-antitoxin system VapC family toxin [Afifella pfennigii]